MLASDLRRHNHDIHLIDHPSPALQPPHLAYFDRLPYTLSSVSPSPSELNRKAASGYFDSSATAIDSSASTSSLANQYMTDAYGYSNPAIRIQQSTPTPGLELPQTFTDNPNYNHGSQWNNYGSNEQMVSRRNLQAAAINNRNRSHQRAQSSSSMGSNGSGSPYSHGHATYSYANESSPVSKLGQNFNNPDHSSSAFSNHLPTPTQTPTQDSFMTTSYPSYSQGGDINSIMAAHLALNTAFDSHSIADDDAPAMSHSGRQSVSSVQDPLTPRTIPEGYDGDFKVPSNDQSMRFPKIDRHVSESYQDELFTPVTANPAPVSSAPKSKQYLTPHRSMINEYLQAAQMARSQSPTSSHSRGVSPFRPDSPYVQGAFGQMQKPYNTASQVRQAQQARASQKELSQHIPHSQNEEPKTISPKDAVLEYNETEEDAKLPLFSETEASAFGQQFNGGQQNFPASTVQNVGSLNPARAADWSTNVRRRSNNAAMSNPNSAPFNFATPAISSNFQGLPFSSQNYRSTTSSAMKQEDSTPDFPAHLTSMESSASEAPPSSQNSNHHFESKKPVSSAADSGTYTCTYHGCTLRFETPQKLQKHKREGHRNTSAGVSAAAVSPTPGVGSGMTSAALAQRNSQAGPHKCERINPTTGKPCNTIFSRPYDLTRHEDTIHNARKQKVRCALCVEEKTFSRNDALTRHMRVVHPEVDFPGKHRRRGGSD